MIDLERKPNRRLHLTAFPSTALRGRFAVGAGTRTFTLRGFAKEVAIPSYSSFESVKESLDWMIFHGMVEE